MIMDNLHCIEMTLHIFANCCVCANGNVAEVPVYDVDVLIFIKG